MLLFMATSLRSVQTDQTRWSNIKHCLRQHVWPVLTAQSNMLDNAGRCWTMMDEIWLCSNFSSNIVQQFPLAWSKIRHNFVPGTEIQHCWMMLDSFKHSSIQHNPTLIKHRPTLLNVVGFVWTLQHPTLIKHRPTLLDDVGFV